MYKEPFEIFEVEFSQLLCEWAEKFNTDSQEPKPVVACSSGTAALHLALEALELKRGSKVLVPDFCMVAVPRAVVLAGLEPVFVDCCGLGHSLPYSPIWNSLRFQIVESMYQPAALIQVHLYGKCSQPIPDNLAEMLYSIVEDMAELHGYPPSNNTDLACWSFYKNKILHGEEGGAVCIWNYDALEYTKQQIEDHLKSLRCLGFTKDHDFNHIPRGHNYRLANSLATLICQNISTFPQEFLARQKREAALQKGLPFSHYLRPPCDSPWVFDYLIPPNHPKPVDKIIETIQLKVPNAGVRHFFKPMSTLPEFKDCAVISKGPSQAAQLAARGLYFTLAKDLLSEEIACLADILKG